MTRPFVDTFWNLKIPYLSNFLEEKIDISAFWMNFWSKVGTNELSLSYNWNLGIEAINIYYPKLEP